MRELQEWMLDAITGEEAPDREAVLARLTEAERIELYRGMYELRMIESLTNDYPALAALLGEHHFAHLVNDYVHEYPSETYTLNRLGDHLPEFLRSRDGAEKTDPGCDDGPASELTVARAGFLEDLARLELAMTEVFDEDETPLLDPEAVASITPETKLPLIAALRLLEFDYPVNDFFQAYRDDEPLEVPAPRNTYVAIHRRDYSVIRTPLDDRAFRFLMILKDGATLGEACDEVVPAQEELFTWFRDWSAAGFFGDPT